MRVFLKLLVLLGAIVAGAWIGGEVLLARKVAALVAEQPQVEAAAVQELRDPRRVGIRIAQLRVEGPEGAAALPFLALWVPPYRPNELNVTLPPAATVESGLRSLTLGAEDAGFSARFAPVSGLALSYARFGGRSFTLDGQPVAKRIETTARLTGFGSDAPRRAGAAYDVTANLDGVALAALTGGLASESAGLVGVGRVWLDRAPARGGSAEAPRLVGLRADDFELRLGDLSARIRGRLVADARGNAEGRMLIDTADAEGFVARAEALGLLPRAGAVLATGLLRNLAEGTAAMDDGTAPAALPPPGAGEVRIAILFRDGRAWLGPLPVGPAPRFPL